MTELLSLNKAKSLSFLKTKKGRLEAGQFLAEGPHLIEEILKQDKFKVSALILREGYKGESFEGLICPRYLAEKKTFNSLVEVENSQGILAVVDMRAYSLDYLISKKKELLNLLLLVGIQDPGNLGAIFRSAAAFNVQGIILSSGCVEVYNSKVIRASSGAVFHVPFVEDVNLVEFIKGIKGSRDQVVKVKIIGTAVKDAKSCIEANLKPPIALLIGNEGAGLPGDLLALADEKVMIPMPGEIESLNAAVSTGILLYEIMRQRKNK